MFEHVDSYPGDPILSLNERFQTDPRPDKINLSIGIYFDGAGKLPVMAAVRQAESTLLQNNGPRSYLPMAGLGDYRRVVQELVFGANCAALAERRIATVQTLGGSGALKIGGDFLHRYFPASQIWISDPSWENHKAVFEGAGFRVNTYPYYDPETGSLRFDDMLATLETLPQQSVVLLHACCHNPTGVDLSQAQWQTLIPLLRRRGLIAFVDMAYQGFGDGLDQDAFAVRALVAAGVTCAVANSFSKNFALYGERCGGLSIVCDSAEEADRVLGQLTFTVRGNYSSPPTHGARIIATVLNSSALSAQWRIELDAMRERIQAMRHALHADLSGQLRGHALSRYLTQRGMFTYTGLSAEQVDRLRDERAVYLVRNGRMCVAGLNDGNVAAVADAFARVLGDKF